MRSKHNKRPEPCEKCTGNLWKTKTKDREYECRYCGYIRVLERDQ